MERATRRAVLRIGGAGVVQIYWFTFGSKAWPYSASTSPPGRSATA